MKIFLSWSGERSKKIASLLREWLSCVIQASKPWFSADDLERGSVWFNQINDQLQDTNIGVICLTKENKDKPWILFEAGALSKGLSTSRLLTLLIDLEPGDIAPPLSQIHHTFPDKKSMYGLVRTLNDSVGGNRLDPAIVEQIFETYWPQFEEKFGKILEETKGHENTRSEKSKDQTNPLSEILEKLSSMDERLQRLDFHTRTQKSRFDEFLDRSPRVSMDGIIGRTQRDSPFTVKRAELEFSKALSDAALMGRSGASFEEVVEKYQENFPRDAFNALYQEYKRNL